MSNLSLKDRITKTPIANAISSPTANLIARDNKLAESSESLGQFKAYSNDLPIEDIVSTRIVKCLYQVNQKTGKKAGDNSYVRIPTKHITEETITNSLPSLMPHIMSFLYAEEDKLIKAQHKAGAVQVFTDYLTLDKIIESLESTSTSARLTKESIATWFDESMQEPLLLLMCDKLGITDSFTPEQETNIGTMINAYKDKFCTLASPKAYLQEADQAAMISVLAKCEEQETSIGARLITKLKNMNKADGVSLLEL